MAGLVETLGGAHGGLGRKAEARVCFDLESGGCEWDGGGFNSLGKVDCGDGKERVFQAFEESGCFFFGINLGFFKNGVESRIAEVTRDFKVKFFAEFFDFALFFDDQAEGRRLDAAGGNCAWDLSADDAGEVKTDEHVEGLAGLL